MKATYHLRKVTIVVLMFIQSVGFAQLDPLNNQYLLNQSMINPAYVGAYNMAMVTMSTRGQWIGIDGAPWTHALSLNTSITDQMGAGLLVINDVYGVNNNLESILAYSYKIKWYDNSLSFGLQGGFARHRLDYSKLNSEANDDPYVPIGGSGFNVTNFGTGVFFMNKNYYAGISIPRFMKVNLTDGNAFPVRYKRHYYISTGYVFDYLDFLKIKPSILVKIIEGEALSIDINGQMMISERVWLGASLRNLNAVGFNFQYTEDGLMRFGYSFELPIGPLALASYGIHELFFSIDAAILKKQKTPIRYF